MVGYIIGGLLYYEILDKSMMKVIDIHIITIHLTIN